MLIFGSTAAKYWFSDFNDPKDIDYICKNPPKSSREEEYYWNEGFQYILDNNKDSKFVDPNFLYTIKFSHAAWDVRWTKTLKHIQFFKEKGCKIDWNLYKILYKDWEILHGKKKVNLNQTNDKFFNKHVKRVYDHDWLHEQFAFYDKPLHNKIRPGDSPMASEYLWKKLPYDDKIKCALEEIYVIATERYSHMPYKMAKYKSIYNLITSMTKGWFNIFLIDNFEELLYNELDKHWIKKSKEIK